MKRPHGSTGPAEGSRRHPLLVAAACVWATGCFLFRPAPAGPQSPVAAGGPAGTSSPAAAAQPAAPAVYRATVRVHSGCDENVRVFRGRTNRSYSGSGTYGWHSPNTWVTYHLSGDDELCIVESDDHTVVSCTKPADGAQLEITESCTGFRRW